MASSPAARYVKMGYPKNLEVVYTGATFQEIQRKGSTLTKIPETVQAIASTPVISKLRQAALQLGTQVSRERRFNQKQSFQIEIWISGAQEKQNCFCLGSKVVPSYRAFVLDEIYSGPPRLLNKVASAYFKTFNRENNYLLTLSFAHRTQQFP